MAVEGREQDINTRKTILLQPPLLVKYLRFGSQHFYPPCAPRVCALLRTWAQISLCTAQARPSSHLCSLARGAGVLLAKHGALCVHSLLRGGGAWLSRFRGGEAGNPPPSCRERGCSVLGARAKPAATQLPLRLIQKA